MASKAHFVSLPCDELRRFMVALLVAAGALETNAEAAAEVHLDADLKGLGVQGVDYLPYTLRSLKRGLIDGLAEPEVVKQTAASALVDGKRGLGQPAAILASDVAAALAAREGSATVAICNSTDIYMIGYYAERIARAGKIGIVMTSGPPLVRPHGGVDPMLSTNPIAFGIPRKTSDPLVFDMATSAIASSRVRQAAYDGTPLPEGSGIGPDGRPTTDAALVRQGAISPLAGHKGFGLALCIGLMCGPLTGSGIGPELAGWQATGETRTQGHLVMAIDPAAFGDREEFAARAERYIQTIKQSRRAPGVNEIRSPGERSAALRAKQRSEGVQVLLKSLQNLEPYAEDLAVPMPSRLAAALTTRAL
jgi:LDH2 family malate/lactate/ureidoglycolate dehydrogenase